MFSLATTAVVSDRAVLGLDRLGGRPGPALAGEWSAGLLAIGLGGVYLFAQGWDRDRAGVTRGLAAFVVLAVWWLAVPISPLPARVGVSPLVALPVATALMALAAVAAALWGVNRPGWRALFWRLGPEADERSRLDAFAMQGGLTLAILAACFTRGAVNLTTVFTLLLATGRGGFGRDAPEVGSTRRTRRGWAGWRRLTSRRW